MQQRIVVPLAAMAWPSVGSADPARGAPMSRGSRVGYGREIGPRCRGPKSPANVELLQVLKDRLGNPAVLRPFSEARTLRRLRIRFSRADRRFRVKTGRSGKIEGNSRICDASILEAGRNFMADASGGT